MPTFDAVIESFKNSQLDIREDTRPTQERQESSETTAPPPDEPTNEPTITPNNYSHTNRNKRQCPKSPFNSLGVQNRHDDCDYLQHASIQLRPVLFSIKDIEQRNILLSRSKNLRQSNGFLNNFFIAPDYTPQEREENRKLVEELRERKNNSEEWLTIRRGKRYR